MPNERVNTIVIVYIYGLCKDEFTSEWKIRKTRNFGICIKGQALKKKILPEGD